MHVWIKKFDVEMKVKGKGIELTVYDSNDKQLGDLVINKAKLIWCKGKTSREKGIPISWNKFIDYMESK